MRCNAVHCSQEMMMIIDPYSGLTLANPVCWHVGHQFVILLLLLLIIIIILLIIIIIVLIIIIIIHTLIIHTLIILSAQISQFLINLKLDITRLLEVQ